MRFKEGDTEAEIARRQAVEAIRAAQEKELPSPQVDEEEDPVRKMQREGLPKSIGEIQVQMHKSHRRPRDMAPPVGLLQPAFTRRREIEVGRWAMMGYFVAAFWEVVLPWHPSVMQQLSSISGLDTAGLTFALAVFVLSNAVGALAPWSPTYDQRNLLDVGQRPLGPPFNIVNPANWKQFFGVSGFGFTKANELFNARLAMLGFVAAIVNELRFGVGTGPVTQIAYYLGVTPDDNYYMLVARCFGAFAVLAFTAAFLSGKPGWQSTPEDEIY